MKSCQVCSLLVEDELAECPDCGEASWAFAADVVPVARAKKAKSKAAKNELPAVEEPPVAPVADVAFDSVIGDDPVANDVEFDSVIGDVEFTDELTKASDDELLALIGDARLPANWRVLVDAEIVKRGNP